MRKLISGLLLSSAVLLAGNFNDGLKLLDNGKVTEAHQQFLTLAKDGDKDAQTILGEMYLDGIGVKQNNKQAYYWIYKAATAGDNQAKYLLGFMYENGIEVKENMVLAVQWYEKAANGGDVMAMYNLAFIYKDGKGGVDKNMQKAVSLLDQVEKIRSKNI